MSIFWSLLNFDALTILHWNSTNFKFHFTEEKPAEKPGRKRKPEPPTETTEEEESSPEKKPRRGAAAKKLEVPEPTKKTRKGSRKEEQEAEEVQPEPEATPKVESGRARRGGSETPMKTTVDKTKKKVTIMTPSTQAASKATGRGAKKVVEEKAAEETATKRPTRSRK